MKLSIEEKKEKGFSPFVARITIESEREARLLFHIFNRGDLKKDIMDDDYRGDYNMDIAPDMECDYGLLENELESRGITV